MYKETAEANDSDIQMEYLGKFSSGQLSSLPHPDYEDEGSRQYFEEKERVEYREINNQEEHTPTQPNDYSEVEVERHHHKVTVTRLLGQFQRFVSMYMMPLFDYMARINRGRKVLYKLYCVVVGIN